MSQSRDPSRDESHSFEIEDERWSRENQIKDWLILAGMIALAVTVHLVIFFTEPGLR